METEDELPYLLEAWEMFFSARLCGLILERYRPLFANCDERGTAASL
jgi:hypothetical protein